MAENFSNKKIKIMGHLSQPTRVIVSEESKEDPGNLFMVGMDNKKYQLYGALPSENEVLQDGWRIVVVVRDKVSNLITEVGDLSSFQK